MAQWEYAALTFDGRDTKELLWKREGEFTVPVSLHKDKNTNWAAAIAAMGEEEWELVHATENLSRLVFKRQVKPGR